MMQNKVWATTPCFLGQTPPLATYNARLEAEGAGLRAQIKVMEQMNEEKGKTLDKMIALLTEQRAKRGWWPFK